MRRVRNYIVDGRLLRVVRNGRKAVVYYDDRRVFNNIKNKSSFRKFWRLFKKQHKDVTWVKFSKKRMKEKEPEYFRNKMTGRNKFRTSRHAKREDSSTNKDSELLYL